MWDTLLVVILCIIALLMFNDATKPREFPPGPLWLPLMGSSLQFVAMIRRVRFYHVMFAELAAKYGPLVGLRLGKDRMVLVSGGLAVKHVLARGDCDGRPDGFYFRMRTFGERLGIICLDGPAWQAQRTFAHRHLRQLGLGRDAMEGLILEETEALVASLRDKFQSTEGVEVCLSKLCDIGVVNCIWAVVAGKRFELKDARLTQLLSLVSKFVRHIILTGALIHQIPALRYIMPDRIGYTKLSKTIVGLQAFLFEEIKEHQNAVDPDETRDLIDAFLHKMNAQEPSKVFTEHQLLALCMDFFMAGSETTSNTLGFSLLYLLHHPEVQRRAQADIDALVGRARLPCLADRPQLPYLEAVIMEVQRMNTVAPIALPHTATEDCEIYKYRVPKDTMLLLNLWSVHMDVEHWGDPDTFRPERFLDATGHTIVKDDWFIPYSGGKRRCLGEALAKNSLFLFLAALLQNFTFALAPGQQLPSLLPLDGITIAPLPFTGIVTLR